MLHSPFTQKSGYGSWQLAVGEAVGFPEGEILGLGDGRLDGLGVTTPIVVVVVATAVVVVVVVVPDAFFVGDLVVPPIPMGLRVGAGVPSFTLVGFAVGTRVLGWLQDPSGPVDHPGKHTHLHLSQSHTPQMQKPSEGSSQTGDLVGVADGNGVGLVDGESLGEAVGLPEGEILGLGDGRLDGLGVTTPIVVVVVATAVVVVVVVVPDGLFVGDLVVPPIPMGLRVGAGVPSFTLVGFAVGTRVLGWLQDPSGPVDHPGKHTHLHLSQSHTPQMQKPSEGSSQTGDLVGVADGNGVGLVDGESLGEAVGLPEGEILGLGDGRLDGLGVTTPIVVVVVATAVVVVVVVVPDGLFVGDLVVPPIPMGLRVGAGVPSFTLVGFAVGALVLCWLHDPSVPTDHPGKHTHLHLSQSQTPFSQNPSKGSSQCVGLAVDVGACSLQDSLASWIQPGKHSHEQRKESQTPLLQKPTEGSWQMERFLDGLGVAPPGVVVVVATAVVVVVVVVVVPDGLFVGDLVVPPVPIGLWVGPGDTSLVGLGVGAVGCMQWLGVEFVYYNWADNVKMTKIQHLPWLTLS
jgi:hypothetical protein